MLQAVFVAVKNKMDLSIAVALGSSIQVGKVALLPHLLLLLLRPGAARAERAGLPMMDCWPC